MANNERAGTHRVATRQRLEMLGGFVGFFTVIAAVNAAVLIVKGRPSVWASVVLAVFLVLAAATYRAWKRADHAVNTYGCTE